MVVNLKTTTTNILERTENVKAFFNDIKKFDILTQEKEQELIKRYKEGNEKEKKRVRDILINSNQRFIIAVAKKYSTTNDFLDVVNEANIGYIEAIDKYDPSRECKRLNSYAIWYIRRAINLYKINVNPIVKNNNASKTYHLVAKATNDFIQKELREPTSEELFELINTKYDANIRDIRDVIKIKTSSIDEFSSSSNDDTTHIGDMAAYNNYSASTNSYENKLENESNSNIIEVLTQGLPEREITILKMSFGIGYPRQMSNIEIGEEIGMVPERVRQLKKHAIERMQEKYSRFAKRF